MKNSKLNFKNIVFVLFIPLFFLSVNILAQQKKDTQNKNAIPKAVAPKTVAPKKIVTAVKKVTTEDSLKCGQTRWYGLDTCWKFYDGRG
jgi:hypothetical protein